jgi:hypothetical protein
MADDLKQGLGLEESLPILKSMQSEESRQKSETNKAAEAKILSYEGQYSKPAPDFKPSEESASGFAALGALLAASGAILGSGGKTSGLMAMNAVAGMMNGYNAGRKDLYEQERQKFEESMKSWEKNRALIKDAFDRAMKIAPTNLKLAQESLNRDLISLGQRPLAEMVQRSGPMPAAAAFYRANDNTTNKLNQLSSVLGTATSQLTPAQKQYFDKLTTNLARVKFLEDVEAEQKASVGTGALEWVKKPDGTIDRMTQKQVNLARASGQDVQYIPTPSAKSEAAVDKQYVQDRAKRIALYLEKPLSTWDRRKADGQEIEKILARDYPQYDEKKYATRTAAQKAFATGKEATTSRSLEVVFDHLATLDDLNDARNAGDIQRFNQIAASWASQFGATAPTNFETAVSQIGAEVTKAIGGAGYTGALTDREEARSAFDNAKTPEQVTGAIATVKRLVGGQLKGIGDQYERTTGEKFADSNILPDTILKDMGWTSRIFKDGKFSESAPAPTPAPAAPVVGGAKTLPAEAVAKLKEGVHTTFSNNEVWTLTNGVPTQIK